MYESSIQALSEPPERRVATQIKALVPWLCARSEILAKCQKEVVLDILLNCSVEIYNTDNVIIKSGERGDSFFIILSGSVSVWVETESEPLTIRDRQGRRSTDQRETFGKCITTLQSGAGFGEVALINKDCMRTASVICDEPTQLIQINRQLYKRSIMSWQAKDLYERYDFLHNCGFFSLLSNRFRHHTALSMSKVKYSFGNHIMKQGDRSTKITFMLSGQVRVSCNSGKLQNTLIKHKGLVLQTLGFQVTARKAAELSQVTPTRDMCLLGAYDAVGALEASLNLPTYAFTVQVEQETTCFEMSREAFDSLLRDRSPKTVAVFCQLALMQTEGRSTGYREGHGQGPQEDETDYRLLLALLHKTLDDLAKTDNQLIGTIQKLSSKFKPNHAARGYTSCTGLLNTANGKRDRPKTQRKPADSESTMRSEGRSFLSSIGKASRSPSVLEAKLTCASRYAMPIGLPLRNSTHGYIRSLIKNEKINDRILAWRCQQETNQKEDTPSYKLDFDPDIPICSPSTQKSNARLTTQMDIISVPPTPRLASLLVSNNDVSQLSLVVKGYTPK